jgi:hypothetical protein
MGLSQKRDMDVIRELLLEIEGGRKTYELLDRASADALGVARKEDLSDERVHQICLYLGMLENAKFIELQKMGGGVWWVKEISWAGHDFIDSVRDPEIWKGAKGIAARAGGFTAGLLAAAAKGLIKSQMQAHGIEMEF